MPTLRPILFGNSFPLTLIRRPVQIEPRSLAELRQQAELRQVVSFWGHSNTLAAAHAVLGFDPRPAVTRPALTLDAQGYPMLCGQSFDEAWILSPDYAPGFRPQIGQEVPAEAILSWQVLRLAFQTNE